MKKALNIVIVAGQLALGGGAYAEAAEVSDYAGSSIVEGIAPYVYPANKPKSPASMQFMPDGETYLMAIDDCTRIVSYDTKTGKETGVIFDVAKARETRLQSFEGYIISPDGSKLLIYTDSRSIYRRSLRARYYVYELRSNILRPLSEAHPMQQSPVFSPDGRIVAFVAGNDIYMKKLDYNSEVRVTTDGEINSIINGVPDWTYEEEFATDCSMEWSADSGTFCYLKYNEAEVGVYTLPLYEGSCDPMKEYELYPGIMSYKYPVAGSRNSVVSLHSYDVATRKTKEIALPEGSVEYIPRIRFTPSGDQLLVATLNRDQTRMEIFSVNPKSTVVKSLIVEKHTAWIDPSAYENIVVTPSSVIIHSSRSGYNHLYEYSFGGSLMRQITSGDFDVTDCYGMDASGAVYYRSTGGNPLNRIVQRTDAKGRTSNLSPAEGWGEGRFTASCNYFILNYSDASHPPVYTLLTSTGKSLRVLEDNGAYASLYASAPRREFITVESDGYALNGYIVKPAGFDPSCRYPVIMWQYSGPGSQEVRNSWHLDWDAYAALKGFVVVCVDGRGTGGRGRRFMDVVYRNLGHYETIDQLNVARYVATLPYADSSRIGIAGWSYGGYEALMCVSAEGFPFRAACAIAPVTDWRYYDTIYAERYMTTPQANEDGYRRSAPINFVDRLDSSLLMMYGTADDNVHPANTLEYVARLQSAGKLCDMFIFPNMNHSIFGCNARQVVYGRMIQHFIKNL